MAEIKSFSCDVCKVLKQQTNHWWIIRQTSTGLSINKFDGTEYNADTKHACGIQHTLKLVTDILDDIVTLDIRETHARVDG